MISPAAYVRRLARRARRGAEPLGPASGPRPAFSIENRPLLFPEERVVVSWSPKCACTHVVAWFFQQQDLLRASDYYSAWPHNFRHDVYYRTDTYRRAASAATAAGGAGWTLLRVVRDPEPRMVSVFRHAMLSRTLWPAIADATGHDVGTDGLSLRELDQFLARADVRIGGMVDVHFRPQAHPVWDMPFDRTITLNIDTTPLEPGLAAVESELGLKGRGIAHGASRLRHRAGVSRYAVDVAYDGAGPIETHRFRLAEKDRFPKRALLASPLVREMAHRHHGLDVGRVATGDTAGRLFVPGRDGEAAPDPPPPAQAQARGGSGRRARAGG